MISDALLSELFGEDDSMDMQALIQKTETKGWRVIECSAAETSDGVFLMAEGEKGKILLVFDKAAQVFQGYDIHLGEMHGKECPLSEENASRLRTFLPWLNPIAAQGQPCTIGLGDRLGLVTGAHIRALEGRSVFPMLAQQSERELILTGRTPRQMLDGVMWQVFEAGYRGGYAADGDHLKDMAKIREALDLGYSFITLDCSDLLGAPQDLASETRKSLHRAYGGQAFQVEDLTIKFSEEMVDTVAGRYYGMIEYTAKVYHDLIEKCEHEVSFELSMDETDFPTSPEAHFFVASELERLCVRLYSLAPRFIGEFQKGIDYIGDVSRFQDNLHAHAAIARRFGYKISVHSGSDKFSIMPFIGAECREKYHLKTSGTSWVEAVRVIAARQPDLFRQLLTYSKEHLSDGKRHYHVDASEDRIPDPSTVPDCALADLLDCPDVRQAIHISYGGLLNVREDGKYIFRDRIFSCLNDNKSCLDEAIESHIKRHLDALGLRSAD